MKVSAILAPLVVILMVLSFAMAAGALLVQSSAQSVDASLQLLEVHARVVAQHHALTQQALEQTQAATGEADPEILTPETWHTLQDGGAPQSNVRVSVHRPLR